jgi:hypothetical protein
MFNDGGRGGKTRKKKERTKLKWALCIIPSVLEVTSSTL